MNVQMENKDENYSLLQSGQSWLGNKSRMNNESLILKMYERFIKKKCKDPPEPEYDQFRSHSFYVLLNSTQEMKINEKLKNNNTLKLTIMKKQILFFTVFVLAIFANITTFGQATPGTASRPLSGCNDDPLHPVPGKSYTYTVGGTGSNFTWWATKDPNFITLSGTTPTTNMATQKLTVTTGQLEATSANYAQTPATATPSVDITWSSQILAGTALDGAGPKTPTFVVVQAEDATNCTNNLKVYQLDPLVAFTVDILPMNTDGTVTGDYNANVSKCFAPVASAVYSAGGVHYNYGTNVLYFEVVAANFFTSYDGSFKINGLQVGQKATVDWSYTTGATATWAPLGAAVTGDGTGVAQTVGTEKFLVDAATNTSDGVSIYLRITIDNGTFEGIAATPIAMLVNGVDSDGNEDVDNNTCKVPAAGSNFEDVATETLTERPTVNSATPLNPGPGNGAFIPAN